jgi:hypothetical protein
MRVKLMSICAFIGGFGLAGLAAAASSAAGHSGDGAAAHAGAGHGAVAVHAGTGHPSARLGGRIPSIGLGSREESELAKLERDRIYRYHFKGFNECATHGACGEGKGGGEMYCRSASYAAITSDLECLSFSLPR